MTAMLDLIEESAAGVTSKGFLALANDALALALSALRLREQPATPAQTDASGLRTVSLAQVGWHDHVADCWVVIYDRVYDLTAFVNEHPGGAEVLLEHGGRDATLAFRGIGHGAGALHALRPYLVGALPEHERIFAAHDDHAAKLRMPGADLPGIRLAAIL